MFEPYSGDLMGLPTDENHLNFRWKRDDCKILFSAAKQGRALSIHIASDKAGLRHIKQAISEFCEFCFDTFDCDMLLGKIGRKSLVKIVLKIGWNLVYTGENAWCVARRRI